MLVLRSPGSDIVGNSLFLPCERTAYEDSLLQALQRELTSPVHLVDVQRAGILLLYSSLSERVQHHILMEGQFRWNLYIVE